MSPPLACVLMASGFSRRFGSNKLLADFYGKLLYDWCMDAIPPNVFAHTAVVTRHPEVESAAERRGFLTVVKPEATRHVSGTIREGLAAVMALTPAPAGCCFMVCDQPLLTRESVRGLAEAFAGEPQCIWALSHGQQKGNPVIFPAALFAELCALEPHERGNAVIQRHESLLRLAEARHSRELLDVDTLAQLRRLPEP